MIIPSSVAHKINPFPVAFARCVIVANPFRFFLKGMCSALSAAGAGSLCLAVQSKVCDPVGRVICCNPELCDLTMA